MKHNKGVHDRYQPPDSNDEIFDRIQARFERLARKVRDTSGTGQTKLNRPAGQPGIPVFAQPEQELFLMLASAAS
jgi:hypothetical protein